MIPRKIIICVGNLFAFAKESFRHRRSRYVSLLAQLQSTPDIFIRARRHAIRQFNNLHPAAKPVVGEQALIRRAKTPGNIGSDGSVSYEIITVSESSSRRSASDGFIRQAIQRVVLPGIIVNGSMVRFN